MSSRFYVVGERNCAGVVETTMILQSVASGAMASRMDPLEDMQTWLRWRINGGWRDPSTEIDLTIRRLAEQVLDATRDAWWLQQTPDPIDR